MLKRVRAGALCVGLASLCVVGTASASVAGPADLGKRPGGAGKASSSEVSASSAKVDLIAVTGTNRKLYVRFTDEPGWIDLGGQLADAPAIALTGNDAYFVGVGTDQNVWIRTFDKPWKRLGPVGSKCYGASARTSLGSLTKEGGDDVLAVACRGSNNRLYTSTVVFDDSGPLPVLPGWKDRGGSIKHGVTIADNGEYKEGSPPSFLFGVVGSNDYVYFKYDDQTRWFNLGFRCGATLELSEYAESFACRDFATENLIVYNEIAEDLQSISGRVAGRPGVAVDFFTGAARYYVTGVDRNLYVASQNEAGTISRFVRINGQALYGIVAVSLTPPPA